jgi:hypothetical protein
MASRRLHQLFPHEDLNIRSDGGCHPGSAQDVVSIVDARAATVIHLLKDQIGVDASPVADTARSDEIPHDLTTLDPRCLLQPRSTQRLNPHSRKLKCGLKSP